MSACRRSSPGPGLHYRDDRQFRPQSGDHLPPLARARLPRLLAVLRRRLRWARGQLFRLFGVRFACARLGIAVTPAILPLFIAAGSGVAMVLTFVGFRFFAFRH
jgi:hypothetical protein